VHIPFFVAEKYTAWFFCFALFWATLIIGKRGCGEIGKYFPTNISNQTPTFNVYTICREIGKAGRRLSLRSGSALNAGK